jgi:glycoside/pentoside/hexuronide:cation symporter, GPH family
LQKQKVSERPTLLPIEIRGSMSDSSSKVSLSTKIYYGFGSVAYGAKDNGFSYFILLFYSQVLGLSPSLTSLALFIALCFDAISDPAVGYLSDNLHSKWGRRHPFMYASCIPIVVSYYFAWHPPQELSQSGLFFYLIALAVLVRTFVTMYEIPSTSLVAELTDDYDERTSMLSFRYFFGWWGGLTMSVSALMYWVRNTEEYPDGMLNPEGWGNYGTMAALMMAVGIMISALGTHKHIPDFKDPPPKAPFNLKRTFHQLKETLSNKSFLALFISALLFAVGAGVSTTLNIYFSRYFWGLEQWQITLLPLSNFLSAILALFLAPMLTARSDKRVVAIRLWILAILFLPLPVLCRLIGIFPENGSSILLPLLVIHSLIEVTMLIIGSILISSMVADIVEDSEKTTGRRNEGLFFAARSFAAKAVNGLGILFAGLILELIRFPVGVSASEVPKATLTNLGLVYVPTIIVFYLLAVYGMTFYRITRSGHSDNLSIIDAQAKADGKGAPERPSD